MMPRKAITTPASSPPATPPGGEPVSRAIDITRPIADQAFTLPQVAALLGVTDWTVRLWIRKGVRGHRLPSLRIGRARYVHKDDLQEWLEVTR